MKEKIRQDLVHDIQAIFTTTIKRIHADREWVDVELVENTDVTACDFPHLLTIAKNYNVLISIYPSTSDQLNVLFKEAK